MREYSTEYGFGKKNHLAPRRKKNAACRVCFSLVPYLLKAGKELSLHPPDSSPVYGIKGTGQNPTLQTSMIFLLRFCTTPPARTPLAYNAPDLYITASSSLIHLPVCLIHSLFVCLFVWSNVMTSFLHLAHLHKESTHKISKTSFWRDLRISPTHTHTHSINQDLLTPKCKSNVISPLLSHL